MKASDPKTVSVAYHEAFNRGDRAAVRALLADSGTFKGPLESFTSADTFLDTAAKFMKLNKKMALKQAVADGADVVLLWDYTTRVPSIPTIPIAEWHKVEGGKIHSIHLHFDPTAIVNALQSGEIAKILGA